MLPKKFIRCHIRIVLLYALLCETIVIAKPAIDELKAKKCCFMTIDGGENTAFNASRDSEEEEASTLVLCWIGGKYQCFRAVNFFLCGACEDENGNCYCW